MTVPEIMTRGVSLGENPDKKIPSLTAHQISDHVSFERDAGEQLAPDVVKVPIGDWCVATQLLSERVPTKALLNHSNPMGRFRYGPGIPLITAPIRDLEATQAGNGITKRHINDYGT